MFSFCHINPKSFPHHHSTKGCNPAPMFTDEIYSSQKIGGGDTGNSWTSRNTFVLDLSLTESQNLQPELTDSASNSHCLLSCSTSLPFSRMLWQCPTSLTWLNPQPELVLDPRSLNETKFKLPWSQCSTQQTPAKSILDFGGSMSWLYQAMIKGALLAKL